MRPHGTLAMRMHGAAKAPKTYPRARRCRTPICLSHGTTGLFEVVCDEKHPSLPAKPACERQLDVCTDCRISLGKGGVGSSCATSRSPSAAPGEHATLGNVGRHTRKKLCMSGDFSDTSMRRQSAHLVQSPEQTQPTPGQLARRSCRCRKNVRAVQRQGSGVASTFATL